MVQRSTRLETRLVHAGGAPSAFHGAKVTPIVRSTVFTARDNESYGEMRYGRLSTLAGQTEVASAIASIEAGQAALVMASGMAAITTALLACLAGGGHLLAQRPLYGATQHFVSHELAQLGASSSAIDVRRPETWAAALRPETRALYVEAIGNPLMDVADHRQVVAFAREHRLLGIIDNTFATPVNFRPLELGFDVVVHSATKYLNGHSDVSAGVLAGPAALLDQIWDVALLTGAVLGPFDAWLLLRGLRTLPLRMPRHNANGQALAAALTGHPAVARVHYPGLASHPQHELADSQMSGFGGVLGVELAGGFEAADAFLGRLRYVRRAASLGGVESLAVHPASMWRGMLSQEQIAASGVPPGLVRLAAGTEDPADLVADALAAADAVVAAPARS
jgi:cystathionine beta-lyase/cystathionine gamma-synthase